MPFPLAPNTQPASDAPIADALVLVFTEGVSLRQWVESGMVRREWALYERLSKDYGRLIVVTYGDETDDALAGAITPSPIVICNRHGLEAARYKAGIPGLVLGAIADARTAVVKTNQMQGGSVAVSVARALRAAGVRTGLIARGGYLWSQFIAVEHGPHSAKAGAAGAVERELCRAADVVVGTTQRMLDDLAWRHHLDPAHTLLIPNYVLTEHAPLRDAPRSPTEVLYAGQLVRRKNVDVLIDAVAKIAEAGGPPVHLAIVGNGVDEPALRQRASDLEALARPGATATVTFEPRLPHDELLARMARCAIYAHASSLEGHPKTVLEAMAAGAAVVVADSPGLGEVVHHGVDGIRVDGTPESFAHAIHQLLEDEDWRRSLGDAAMRAVRQKASLDTVYAIERRAHMLAISLAGQAVRHASSPVRFDPELLDADPALAAAEFAKAITGFARRLSQPAMSAYLRALAESLNRTDIVNPGDAARNTA